MSWSEETLSTRSSVSRIESEMIGTGFISDTDLSNKIAIAKELIGNDLQSYLVFEKSLELLDEESALDRVTNPSVFSTASDYLIVALIYEDIAMRNQNDIAYSKYERFYKTYKEQYDLAKNVINLDITGDGNVDEYRARNFGMLIR